MNVEMSNVLIYFPAFLEALFREKFPARRVSSAVLADQKDRPGQPRLPVPGKTHILVGYGFPNPSVTDEDLGRRTFTASRLVLSPNSFVITALKRSVLEMRLLGLNTLRGATQMKH